MRRLQLGLIEGFTEHLQSSSEPVLCCWPATPNLSLARREKRQLYGTEVAEACADEADQEAANSTDQAYLLPCKPLNQ